MMQKVLLSVLHSVCIKRLPASTELKSYLKSVYLGQRKLIIRFSFRFMKKMEWVGGSYFLFLDHTVKISVIAKQDN